MFRAVFVERDARLNRWERQKIRTDDKDDSALSISDFQLPSVALTLRVRWLGQTCPPETSLVVRFFRSRSLETTRLREIMRDYARLREIT